MRRQFFFDYARTKLGLAGDDLGRFRRLCRLSSSAILHGRHCAAFDQALDGAVLPTACWMRDDRLGGRTQLSLVLRYLHEHDLMEVALREKAEAVAQWREIESLAREIQWPNSERAGFARISAEYGRVLFTIIYHGWCVLAAGYEGDRSGRYDREAIAAASAAYAQGWQDYRALAASRYCPTLYEGRYFALPGQAEETGLDESVQHYLHLALDSQESRVPDRPMPLSRC